MKTLIIAEHDNQTLKVATLNAVAAAQAMGGDIDVLIVGSGCQSVADQAAAVPGVGVVLSADNAAYENQLAENVSLAIAEAATSYDCVMAAATANGKNVMPRVAALLDVAQISDITAILDADTFERPIYAGNVIATVKSSDSKKSLRLGQLPLMRLQRKAGTHRCNRLIMHMMQVFRALYARKLPYPTGQS